MEQDEFDGVSDRLLLVHNSSQAFAGTVHFVRTSASKSEQKLPLENCCSYAFNSVLFDLKAQERGTIAEVSRLAVPAQFLCSTEERGKPFIFEGARSDISDQASNFLYITFGLYFWAGAFWCTSQIPICGGDDGPGSLRGCSGSPGDCGR